MYEAHRAVNTNNVMYVLAFRACRRSREYAAADASILGSAPSAAYSSSTMRCSHLTVVLPIDRQQQRLRLDLDPSHARAKARTTATRRGTRPHCTTSHHLSPQKQRHNRASGICDWRPSPGDADPFFVACSATTAELAGTHLLR